MLASEAVARAYREAAIKRIGASLTADEEAEGLARVNDFLFSLFGEEIGERLADVQVPANQRKTVTPSNPIALDYPANLTNFDQPYEPGYGPDAPGQITIPANTRIVWGGTAATTVYLPEFPSDGARFAVASSGATATLTINANGRTIEGNPTKAITAPAAPAEWFYRADLANWIPLAPLALVDSLPLPQQFDSLIISGAAMRLTALDQIEPTKGTLMIYERLLKLCRTRYRQRSTVSMGGQNIANTTQSYDSYGGSRW